jgi:hypothetical protein
MDGKDTKMFKELTPKQKIKATMDYFGLTYNEAVEELIDMGEI